jgi:hypothetical protein
MRFNGSCTAEQHGHILEMLRTLPSQIPQIRALTAGVHVLDGSPTPDIGLVVDFESLTDQQTYMRDPHHVAVGEYYAPIKDSVMLADIEVP